MRQRILFSAAFAAVMVIAGCKAPATAPVNAQGDQLPAIASSQLTGTLSTPSVIAVGGGNVIAVGGGNVIATGGGNVIAVGGGNVIATGGGNVIATGGGNVIATGGGNYRVAQAGEPVAEYLIANARVYLADATGAPYEGAEATTDANGRFTFNEVPGGGTYQIVTELKFEDGKTYALKTLASATEESVAADVDTNSTLVAETFLDGQEFGDFSNTVFRDGLKQAKANLSKADLPDNWTDKESVRTAARKYGERAREFFATLRAQIEATRASASARLQDWKARARERFRARAAAQAATSPSTTSPTSAPLVGAFKKRSFFFPESTPVAWFPMEVELISQKPAHTATLTFTKPGERQEVEVHEGAIMSVRVKRNGTSQFQPRSFVSADPAGTGEIELKL